MSVHFSLALSCPIILIFFFFLVGVSSCNLYCQLSQFENTCEILLLISNLLSLLSVLILTVVLSSLLKLIFLIYKSVCVPFLSELNFILSYFSFRIANFYFSVGLFLIYLITLLHKEKSSYKLGTIVFASFS